MEYSEKVETYTIQSNDAAATCRILLIDCKLPLGTGKRKNTFKSVKQPFIPPLNANFEMPMGGLAVHSGRTSRLPRRGVTPNRLPFPKR